MSKDPIPSTRPYLIRALHEWCTDHGFSPYLAVRVDDTVQVPREHVKNQEIVLNVSYDATGQLLLGNEFIEFKARFGGVAREIVIPIDHVVAIYARENGQGMAFPAPPSAEQGQGSGASGGQGGGAALSAVPSSAPPTPQPADAGKKATAPAAARKDSDTPAGKGLQLVSNHPAEGGEGVGAPVPAAAVQDPQGAKGAPGPDGPPEPSPTDPSGHPPGRPTLTRVK